MARPCTASRTTPMKALKIVLASLAALTLAFFAVGLAMPTLHYETSVEVARPVDQVWAAFMDPARMDRWLAGLREVQPLAGPPGEVGSTARLVFVEDGEEMRVDETILRRIEGEELAFAMDNDVLTGSASVRFTPVGDRTRITCVNDVEGKGPVWRSILALTQGVMEDHQVADFERLAALVESGA